MLDSFFLVAAANKLLNDAASKHNLKEKVKERGWDHPEWNRELQEMIFDKYLWKVGACPEQEFLTTWELYRLAQKELNNQGYKWNPSWNRYTPKQGTFEYVRGTQIYNNLLNSEFHRYGESLDLQDKLFENIIVGEWKPKEKYFEYLCFDGDIQYKAYEKLKIKINCKNNFNNGVFGSNYVEPVWNPNYEKEYEPGRISSISTIVDIGGLHNEYGEPFRWYDDLMPFTPSKIYLNRVSKKTYEQYKQRGIDYIDLLWKMRESIYDTKPQRRQALNTRNERIRNTRNH